MALQKKGKTHSADINRKVLPIVFAAATTAVLVLAMPMPEGPFKECKQTAPFAKIVELASDENAGFEELYDYSPMFIPTRWNYGVSQQDLPPPINWNLSTASKTSTQEFGASIATNEFISGGMLEMERGRSGLLRSIMRSAFSGFGRMPLSQTAAYSPTGSISVIDMSTGETAAQTAIPQEIAAQMISVAEFIFKVEADGRIMRPLTRETSGSDEVDDKLAEMLKVKNFPKLQPGSYKAVFTP